MLFTLLKLLNMKRLSFFLLVIFCTVQFVDAQEYRHYGNTKLRVLSSPQSANCYIVSEAGSYMFATVKGNSFQSVGRVASCCVLWESFGTEVTPKVGDLIKRVSYKDGYIGFQTADTFKEGNAVIAAKDAYGNILWSWHIWLTDQPQDQVYYNNAGIMMDRNLGATSAKRGDVGALGLLYQWGRKDPLGGAPSTITWPASVESNSNNGTIAFATANPTTFITRNEYNYDWYYTGSSLTDNTRWTTSENSKSIYDPCPVGWRVPDGGDNGVWSKAIGSNSGFDCPYNNTNGGMNLSGKFGPASTIWYPAAGFLFDSNGGFFREATHGLYWSASTYGNRAYSLCLWYQDAVVTSDSETRACGQSVRCVKE